MKEKVITRGDKTAIARIPEAADIINLSAGELAPNPWGDVARVDRITHRGVTPLGRHYVGYYTDESGPGKAWISNSMCEGRLVRTFAITCLLNSVECDALEAEFEAIHPRATQLAG